MSADTEEKFVVANVKLTPEDKAAWVAALRSGDYNQGRAVLHNPTENTYCCLGVFCEATGREGVTPFTPNDDIDEDLSINGEVYASLREVLGTTHHDYCDPEDCFGEDVVDKLMDWNDNRDPERHKSFAEIADWIEENL